MRMQMVLAKMTRYGIFSFLLMLASCADQEQWFCKVDGKTMYSISESGKLGSAEKGCSCSQIRSFERSTFGSVDEDAIRNDFNC